MPGDVRMDVRDIRGNGCKTFLQFFLSSLEFMQPVRKGAAEAGVVDGRYDLVDLLV